MLTPQTTYRFSTQASAAQRSEIRELLKRSQTPGMLSLAGGIPAAELIDTVGLCEAANKALAAPQPVGLQYGQTEGQSALRGQIQRWMAAQGVRVGEGELLVTSGSQQGIDLLARAFLQSGDTVLIETPAYLAATQAFAMTGTNVEPVAGDAEGMSIAALDALMQHKSPKLLYMVSNFSNPTGNTWSLTRRLDLLRWAAAHEVFVIEDDPYGQLWFERESPPPLVALADHVPLSRAWCGYMSSLSKTVSPGLRLGWLVLPEPVLDVCVRLKQAMDLQTATLAQEVAAHYLASGRLQERLPMQRALYRTRGVALAAALREQLPDALDFVMPDGGMFIWARLRGQLDATELLEHALAQGLAFVPGAAFYAKNPNRHSLRLSYSNLAPQDAPEAVRRLALALESLNECRSERMNEHMKETA
jgi:2-aminoadipate transaminase